MNSFLNWFNQQKTALYKKNDFFFGIRKYWLFKGTSLEVVEYTTDGTEWEVMIRSNIGIGLSDRTELRPFKKVRGRSRGPY